jgi:hypothetical protein
VEGRKRSMQFDHKIKPKKITYFRTKIVTSLRIFFLSPYSLILVMCCVLIWERVGSKIRERGNEEEILQLYCSQLSSESCAIKIFSSTTASQYYINFSLSRIKDRKARIHDTVFLLPGKG